MIKLNKKIKNTIILFTQVIFLLQFNPIQSQNTQKQSIVLLGENPGTCNILGDLEIEGEEIFMGQRPQYALSAQECCTQCKNQENCNAWAWCSNSNGCDGSAESFTKCTLKTYLTDFPQWKNEGQGWISGYTNSNCPTLRREQQLVDFSNFRGICASEGNQMCSDCMCELSREFEEYNGDQQDLGLCGERLFFGALGLPQNNGGAGVSPQDLENLKKCPVSSDPCTNYKNTITYFTPQIGYNSQKNQTILNDQCQQNIEPLKCAESCEEADGCNAFIYNAVQNGGTCCFLFDPPREVWFDPQGWQTYFRMEQKFDPNSIINFEPIKINEIKIVPNEEILETAFDKSTDQIFENLNLEESLILGFGCGACHDEPPPQSRFSCDQYRAWDLCDSDFLAGADFPNGFCALTCDRCSCVGLPSENGTSLIEAPPPIQGNLQPIEDPCFCSDFPPEDYNCALVNQLGLCNYFSTDKDSIIPEGYCQTTCGRCDCPLDKLCLCSDVVPPGQWPCDRQKKWGKCEVDWMFDTPSKGGYCQRTCGRCPCVTY